MRFILHQLVEGEEELEIGAYVGALWVDPAGLEVDVDDPELHDRLTRLLLEPLTQLQAAEGLLGTRQVEVYAGEPGYAEALSDRLQRRDFRLLVEEEV